MLLPLLRGEEEAERPLLLLPDAVALALLLAQSEAGADREALLQAVHRGELLLLWLELPLLLSLPGPALPVAELHTLQVAEARPLLLLLALTLALPEALAAPELLLL